MKNSPYVIVVKFKSKAGARETLKKHLRSIIKLAKSSDGCLCHDLHESVLNQEEFMFYEKWEDKLCHEKHIARQEVIAWRNELNILLAVPYEADEWKLETQG